VIKTIYKYDIPPVDSCKVSMPVGAEILTIQAQKDRPCIWALVDPKEEKRDVRVFEVYGTGHSMRCDMGIDRNYIGTYQLREGDLVFHLFERL